MLIVSNLKLQEQQELQRAVEPRNETAAGIKFVITPVIGRAASIYARQATEVNEWVRE